MFDEFLKKMTWSRIALAVIVVLLLFTIFGCARNDGMGSTWKGVACVEQGKC